MIRYLSVCSGIEAATVAWEPLGWEPAAFSEIEPFPRAVLKHHYPDVALHGDFTTIEANQYGPIDLLVGGTPCQSFSIAGLRKGLGDDRGNLALEFLRLAQRKRPRWVLWENVPGVFSSLSHDAPDSCPPDIDLDGPDVPEDGEEIVVEDEYDADENHAFSCFLAGLSELGYGLAWRVLDAQYVRVDGFARAVPQRRRRVFVVGYLGDWRRAAAVLLERESLRRDSPPCRKPGQGFAADVVSSLTASGRGVERAGETRGQDPVVAVHAPIVSPALKARDSKGPSSDGDGDGDGDAPPLSLTVSALKASMRPRTARNVERRLSRSKAIAPVALAIGEMVLARYEPESRKATNIWLLEPSARIPFLVEPVVDRKAQRPIISSRSHKKPMKGWPIGDAPPAVKETLPTGIQLANGAIGRTRPTKR